MASGLPTFIWRCVISTETEWYPDDYVERLLEIVNLPGYILDIYWLIPINRTDQGFYMGLKIGSWEVLVQIMLWVYVIPSINSHVNLLNNTFYKGHDYVRLFINLKTKLHRLSASLCIQNCFWQCSNTMQRIYILEQTSTDLTNEPELRLRIMNKVTFYHFIFWFHFSIFRS